MKKKLLISIIALVMCVALTGCGKKENNQENNYNIEGIESSLNLKINNEPENKNNNQNELDNNINLKTQEDINPDKTIVPLNNIGEIQNDTLNELNISKIKNKEIIQNKPSLMQKTKTWFSKAWQNIKNYDYSKLNIFKGEEMVDCLDAHGFPLKIPKRVFEQKEKKEEEKKE